MNNDVKEIIKSLINIAVTFIAAAIFMVIWNKIMPNLCNFNEITYWQSFFLGWGLRLINGTGGLSAKIAELKESSKPGRSEIDYKVIKDWVKED